MDDRTDPETAAIEALVAAHERPLTVAQQTFTAECLLADPAASPHFGG